MTSKRIGDNMEQLVRSQLSARYGLVMVEKIGTPVKLSPYKPHGRRIPNVYRVGFGEKVSGDIRAFVPGSGRGVLGEVKYTNDDKLIHSRLKPHQVASLDMADQAGAIALLIWVNPWGIYVMRWPIEGFVKGTSLNLETAKQNLWSGSHA